MPRVECEIVEASVQDEVTKDSRPGVIATCSRCEHTTESFGTGENSRKRCLVLMREECPEDEENFYVDSED